ncbi:hypothetical protein ACKWTF_015029 [Chironomus riparius]
MKLKLCSILIVFNCFGSKLITARVAGIVGDKIYECEDIPKYNKIESVDYSNFKIYHENDTHTFLNGSVKFMTGFARLPGRVYTEQYVRGKWIVQLFDRQYVDMCVAFHSPTEPFFNQTRSFPSCPVMPGTEWKFDMVHIVADDQLLNSFPTSLVGLWRMTIILNIFDNGAFKKFCKIVHCDIFED